MNRIYRATMRITGDTLFGRLAFTFLLLCAIGVGAAVGLLFVYSSDLPEIRALEDYRPNVVTELYGDDGQMIGSFALQRRILVTYQQIPKVLKDAVLTTEDQHFEEHWGVDIPRVLQAASHDIAQHRLAEGASTLTMQLAGGLFLNRSDRSAHRKIQETLLAIQIERHYTKEQIFTMYANQIYLGAGNYGFEAASEYYFSKPIGDLTLPEAATLAAIIRGPIYQPTNHPERALSRRNLVLGLMAHDHKISEEQAQAAIKSPLGLHIASTRNDLAPYFVEEVRQYLEHTYGTAAVHEQGLRVYTTLNVAMQKAADQAVRDGLHSYDRRHGWRGNLPNILGEKADQDAEPVAKTSAAAASSAAKSGVVEKLLTPAQTTTLEKYQNDDWRGPIQKGDYVTGLVTAVEPTYATIKIGNYRAMLTPTDFAWTGHKSPRDLLKVGDLVCVGIKEISGITVRVQLEQVPAAQGALLAIDNPTGEVKAMVGGYDFEDSKFNRATQASRQTGSSFKVYVYAEAIEQGISPFDTVVDQPVSLRSGGQNYSPHNYDNKFEGRITYRRALADSRNVPAVLLLDKIGVSTVIDLARKFGIQSPLPPYLPLALGAADLTLFEHTSAFTVFPDDGIHIEPHYIRRVTTYDGVVLEEPKPEVTDVIPPETARTMVAMLEEVVQFGTGVKAKEIGRPSAGKTGTTNDFTDAWYIGFTPQLTAGVWVGNDDPRQSLGKKETGAAAALPIWIEFMQQANQGVAVEQFPNVVPLEKIATTHPVSVDVPDTAPPADVAEQGLHAGAAATDGVASPATKPKTPSNPPATTPH
jgi:penicillin-binding protein 1A